MSEYEHHIKGLIAQGIHWDFCCSIYIYLYSLLKASLALAHHLLILLNWPCTQVYTLVTIFFHVVNYKEKTHFFIICEMPWLLAKDCRVVPYCLLDVNEFKVILLRLPSKNREHGKLCYLLSTWGLRSNRLSSFLRVLVWIQWIRVEFELGLLILHPMPIAVISLAHPLVYILGKDVSLSRANIRDHEN